MEGSSLQLTSHGRIRRAVRRAAVSVVAAGALVTGGMVAAASPSAAGTPTAGPAAATGTAATGATGTVSSSGHTAHLCAAPTTPGGMSCLALARTDVVHSLGITPNATPSGYGPTDLQSAYALPSSAGSGATVAIVDAQDDPNAEADLATYRSQYGLPACTTANGCFKKVNQSGGTSYPSPDSGWAGEISLDLDMVSAVCPQCHILLVEATSASMTNLGTAVNEAVSLGAKYVSNSYGGGESSSDTSYDSSYFNHPGVAITVSSGDEGYGAEYPAASKYVTAVGGTALKRATGTSRGWSETVWNTSSTEGTGSGCSAYDAKPSWQTDSGCSKRTIADVSAVADPATGLAVYDSYQASGWQVYGGTSASSPIIASVYALAGTPASGSTPASYPYSHTSALNDVTSGSNGSCSGSYLCTAQAGYDGPTGLGTPNGTAAFTNGGSTGGNTVSVTSPGNQSTKVGTAVSLQVHATDSASGQTLTYSASGLPAGLSINSSTGVISGTPTTVGNSSVTVTAKDTTNASGSASFTWAVTSTSGGCTASQLLTNPGFESGSTGWTASTGVIDSSTDAPAHSGSYKAWLDGYGTTHTDSVSQSVTIPASCTSANLTFYLYVSTSETTTSTAYDKLTVAAGSSTLASYSNLNSGTGYVQRTVSLTPYIGQTVTLKFTGTEDSSLATSFLIDDTAVNVS
ncbi:putative Ig domain-containing protein [Streptomyces bryophytorum]|uniref:Ig domain-containing protein n=3 Tax=Actinacidiphila bryophytorum TaxID=1436133 RepID=A0A9W4H5T7_9ACTN|nr:putative Ig domain-containing protein [Actinacidiphila bryophytorum]MBN6544243.1 putative Ig domain-containing protein [Actinacidiphila bryophytorum]CAG7653100.1 Putative Ig domain-containing protein [Actinacidiphila bryophytorum]